jgi:ligand-binding sensor domain-containing protein
MKTIKFCILIIVVATISCKKEEKYQPDTQAIKSDLNIGMPGYAIQDMEIDNNDYFYFVTWKSDHTIETTGTELPFRYYLSRKKTEKSEFEILDSNFVHIDKMIFDKNNNFWAINFHALFLRKTNKCDTIIKLNFDKGEGFFTCLAVDLDNNVWAGGPQTGLYKIDKFMNITKYTKANSDLPSNSIKSIFVDKNNIIWVALEYEVLKIEDNNWIVYKDYKFQTIRSLVVDKNDNPWLGQGSSDENNCLVRLNGYDWVSIYPKNDSNEIVLGVVRELYADKNRIYVLIEPTALQYTQQLLTFDGVDWNKIYGFPDLNNLRFVMDLKIDYNRHAVWISVANEGIYKLNLY